MSDNVLKKEFKNSDVQRIRNLVNKDFTSKTKVQSGYQKTSKKHKEGDIWEESGKTWTIKNGIKQNITKLDSIKKAIRVPLACPKCNGSMKHWLAKKMYKIHGFCFDCTVDYETNLRKAGLYEKYEKEMMTGNMEGFVKDLKSYVSEFIDYNPTYVTEAGDVENWDDKTTVKEKALKNLDEYLTAVKTNFS
jgi:bacterioferritin-associated ferredoxin